MKWDLFWIRVMLTLLVLYHLDVIYWQVTTQCEHSTAQAILFSPVY